MVTKDDKEIPVTDVPVENVTVEDITPVVSGAAAPPAEVSLPGTINKGSIAELTKGFLKGVAHQPGVRIVSFEDTEETAREFAVFKAEANRAYRLGFPVPFFVECRIHYHEASKTKFQCLDGACCDRCGPPQRRFGTPAVLYETDSKGVPSQPFGYRLMCFLASEDRANYLQQQHLEWNFTECDVGFFCTDAQYQKGDPSIKRGALWTMDLDECAKILELCQKYVSWIPGRIAKRLSEREMLDVVRGGGNSGGALITPDAGPASAMDFSGLFQKSK